MVQETRTTHTVSSAGYPDPAVAQDTTVTVHRSPTAVELTRRVVIFLFGLLQVLLILRIVALLIDANRDNAIVSFIYNVSALFVAPFEGILNTNALRAGGSVLDVAAVLALVGWTIVEALIVAGIGILDREP